MATEKEMKRKKADGVAKAARRSVRLPWPITYGQLGGKLLVHRRDGTEFQVAFPQGQAK